MVKLLKNSKLSSPIMFSKFASDLQIEELAISEKFYMRKPLKVTATSFVSGFFEMKSNSENSLRKWAFFAGMQNGQVVSKQGIDDRLHERTQKYISALFEKSMKLKMQEQFKRKQDEELSNLISLFNRILVEDSTAQKVPAQLAELFKGPHSRGGDPVATLKVQAIYDIIAQDWVRLEVTPYSKNDQSQSACVLDVCQKGDLILRDLGYFVLANLSKLVEEQSVITKWDNKTNIHLTEKGDKLNLLQLFKNKSVVDINVFVGSKTRIPMRMIARKLPAAEAKKRIAAAKKDRHKNTKHSPEYYEWLKWEIYLTNLPQDQFTPVQIAKLYGLRWYIEILFKALKSHFNFRKFLAKDRMTYQRTMITVHLLLIEVVWLMKDIYHYIEQELRKHTTQEISILKLFSLIQSQMAFIIGIRQLEELQELILQFSKHAVYEKRKKRKNMKEKLRNFNELGHHKP